MNTVRTPDGGNTFPTVSPWAWPAFALILTLPSLESLGRLLPGAALAAYPAIYLLIVYVWLRAPERLIGPPGEAAERRARGLMAGGFLALILAMVTIYPLADAGAFGPGSDSDDALEIAVRELLAGRHPYALPTYLGNPISPMPGAVILAIPFVLLDAIAWQNVFWLAAAAWCLRGPLPDARHRLALFGLGFGLLPNTTHLWLTGSDYVANTLYVVVFTGWLLRAATQPGARPGTWVLPAALLGLGLSSRANFWLLLPLAFAFLYRLAGRRTAVLSLGVTAATLIAVTLPFFLADPAHFTPLHGYTVLGRLGRLVPGADIAILGANVIFALWLAARLRPRLDTLWASAALVLAFPVVVGLLVISVKLGHWSRYYLPYGAFAAITGAIGLVLATARRDAAQSTRR